MDTKRQSLSVCLLTLVSVVLVLLLPQWSEARTVVRSGDTISIGQDQLIEGDFYTAGSIISISGEIEEDLLAAGAEVNLNGEVGADVLIAGGSVDINGTVGDDVRVFGGTVILAEPVLGDVFVIAGDLKIKSTASVTGDVTVIGGMVEINGPVEGRVLGWVDTLRIDSTVAGEVDVTVTSLTLGDQADVSGGVSYVSPNKLIRSQSASVGGEIIRNDPVVDPGEMSVTSLLMPLLVLLFSAALWYLLSRRVLQRVVIRTLTPGLRPVLIGAAVILLAPFAVSILLVSMLGLLAGLALVTTYLLLFTLAIAALPAVLGQFVYTIFGRTEQPVTLLTLLLGTVAVALLSLIPIVGPILLLGFTVLTFGGVS